MNISDELQSIIKVAALLVTFTAGLITLQKGWEIVRRFLHPEDDLRKTLSEQSAIISSNTRRIESLERSLLNEQEDGSEFREAISQAMLANFDHILSGNDLAHIRTARDRIYKYLTSDKRDR